MALADHPRVLLPIIFYNLVQHLVAGAADRLIERGRADDADREPLDNPGPGKELGSLIQASGVRAARRRPPMIEGRRRWIAKSMTSRPTVCSRMTVA